MSGAASTPGAAKRGHLVNRQGARPQVGSLRGLLLPARREFSRRGGASDEGLHAEVLVGLARAP